MFLAHNFFCITPSLSRPHGGLGCRAHSLATRTKGLADTCLLVKDAVAISTFVADTGTRHHIATSARPTDLGNIAGRPNGRTIRLGFIVHEAAIVHYHAGIGRVHDGPTDTGTLFNVVTGIEEGCGNIVQEARGDDHHGTTILQGCANILGEHRIDDVAERSPLGINDGSLSIVGARVAVGRKDW